ncbi:MAG TPA: hypothetical protein ACFYEK_12835 [Candidatus Wunengus sp. YC60]|uniref:hypothetical protein n=1 Tax=Candidatus Wunengus sp. YC60 TaxID=3367697 RepID=UPI00402A0329
MYKQMKDGEYKAEDVFGYCGATGLSITKKYGSSFIGESHEEQTSDKAVGHLHVELHKGEFKHETNQVKELADERIIDPIINFEKWVNEMLSKNTASPAVSEKQEGPIQQSKTVDFKEQKEIRQKEEKPSNLQSKTDNSVWVKIVEMLREWLKVKK